MAKVIPQNLFAGDIGELIVTTAQAQKALGVSNAWLRRMVKERFVSPVSRGKWNLVELIAGRETQMKAQQASASKASAANRATEARTREIEFRIARQEGKFVPIAEFESTFDEIVGVFLTTLSGLPAQITRDRKERERIELICDFARTRMSKQFAQKAVALAPLLEGEN